MAKLLKHRGHIKKRGNNYCVVLSLGYDENGKRIRQWETVVPDKKEAEKRLAELLCEVDGSTFVKPTKETVETFMLDWLAYIRNNVAPRTYEGYELVVNKHVRPSSLGNVPITQLTTQLLRKYFDEKLKTLSPRTVRHHYMVLHGAMGTALQWGRVQRNVLDTIAPPKCERYEAKTMSERDTQKLLEAASETPYYALFYTDIHTGIRLSEILALRWGDIDFILNEIRVRRTLHQLKNGKIDIRDTKTATSRRNIKMTPSSRGVLLDHYEMRKAVPAALGSPLMDASYVFCHDNGAPLLPDSVSHAWIKLVRKVGLDGVRFHDCRHTHATILLGQNIHLKIVQDRLGHATISTTLDLYSHVAPTLQEEAAKAFDNAFSKGLGSNRVAKVENCQPDEVK